MLEQTSPEWVQDAAAEHTEEIELLERKRVSDIIHLADKAIEFVIRGFLIDGTHGMIGGPEKSLKSYIGTFIDLAIISGISLFGHFVVERQGSVVVYVGEGGEVPYLRRVKRIARAMGVKPSALKDYHILTQTAPLGSEKFQKTLERDLAEIGPVLIRIDPYYAYHGGDSDSRNLYQEGAHLNLVSEPCTESNANLLISNHFNQHGKGLNIGRLTMAGGQDWVDSWVLLQKTSDDEQNVAFGKFRLKMHIGSRQWGGTEWILDLNIGRFDMDLGEHVGDISWQLTSQTVAINSDVPKKMKIRKEAIEILTQHPWDKSMSEVARLISAGKYGERLDYLRSQLKRTGETQLIIQYMIPVTKSNGVIQKLPRLGLSAVHEDTPEGYPLPPASSLAP